MVRFHSLRSGTAAEEMKMSDSILNTNEKKAHKQGRAWTVQGRYGTFEDADTVRKSPAPDHESKVHAQGSNFVVKTRLLEDAKKEKVEASSEETTRTEKSKRQSRSDKK